MYMDFPGGSAVKNLLVMQETQVQSLSQEDPLEKKMAIHSSILAWRIPWTKEPGGLESKGSRRVTHDLATKLPTKLPQNYICVCVYMCVYIYNITIFLEKENKAQRG